MPLTTKGNEILAKMKKEYGEKRGEEVFYASKNAGTITGVDARENDHAVRNVRFYTISDIGPNLSFTPEGFLLCKNVPIARTGNQTYYEGEVPITPDQNGAIVITREPEEVFSSLAMASFEGKPVTMTHPDGEVNPDTWKDVSVGHTQNIRKGEGIESDALYADLLIMEKDSIKAVVNHEIREVSGGYDADYEETGPGRGRQLNIRGNHIALVEKGRCGSLCAIHDRKGEPMNWFKKFFDSLTADEQKNIKSVVGTQDAAPTLDQRMEVLEQVVASIPKLIKDAVSEKEENEEEKEKKKKAEDARKAKDAEEEKKKKEEEEEEGKDCRAKDAAFMAADAAPTLQEVLYRASILAPGMSMPTADSIKTMNKKTFDETCCLLKRKSLDAAYKTEAGKAAINPFVSNKAVDFFTADCALCDLAFVGASEVMKKAGTQDRIKHGAKDFGGTKSIADMNKANAEFWANRKGGK